ncbi:MAG: TldE/PmbA family protein [Deltaproteobacteria bacterium]|nr:TldE/PmbA family protein [Deltaproteobacteria bacterium]MBW2412926.1 TldE/PmbA family protein [Deltaproteobacteria bacterium]
MQDYFRDVAAELGSLLRGDEVFTCSFAGEDSDFVRFNRGAIRQAGSVSQRSLGIDLIEGRRHVGGRVSLVGHLDEDRATLARAVERFREMRAHVPEDPLLSYAQDVKSTEHEAENHLPSSERVLDDAAAAGREHDLVGIYAAGGTYAGFANSLGQHNWDRRYSYNFDWSFYRTADRAAKASYAGFDWDTAEFQLRVDAASDQLEHLGRTPRTIEPGRYRVFLAPAALLEIFEMLSWGGFGLRAHRTKTTPLLRMIEGEERLHPSVSIRENTRDGVAPAFQDAGFLRPAEVPLITGGEHAGTLVSPRSALEYGEPTNGANGAEAPLSVELAPGNLSRDRVLDELGTGIYISNLWYLNFSDRSACRTTGMTRFATFWVENGVLDAPLSVMRFDETIFRMLGENLIGLAEDRELLMDPGTYDRRSTHSARLPGALVDEFTLTL